MVRELQRRLSDPFVQLVRDKSLDDIGDHRETVGAVKARSVGCEEMGRYLKKKRGKQMLSLQEFHSIGCVELTPRLISADIQEELILGS